MMAMGPRQGRAISRVEGTRRGQGGRAGSGGHCFVGEGRQLSINLA